MGRLVEPAEFDNIILKTGPDGNLVRLKDVGRAELGAENYNSILRFNGRGARRLRACCSCRALTHYPSTEKLKPSWSAWLNDSHPG